MIARKHSRVKHPRRKKKSRRLHQPKTPVIVDPAHKAMRSKGMTHAGRITLKQFQFLVNHGFDPKAIMGWTNRRAHLAISKIIAREDGPAASGHAELDDAFNQAVEVSS